MPEALRGWTATQKHAVAASYMAWTLDAFDFFVLTFVVPDIAKQFAVSVPTVALAVTLTLAVRPLGAFLFGRLADDYGRRPVLLINVLCYSLFGFATAFAPSLSLFLVIRALFGVAMGGIWGIGAGLAMETIKPQSRGFVSGLLQAGYNSGFLVASLIFGLLYSAVGWRGMFMVGIVPGLLLVLYLAFLVSESPVWKRPALVRPGKHLVHLGGVTVLLSAMMAVLEIFGRERGLVIMASVTVPVLIVAGLLTPFIRRHWKLAVYAIILMTGFNFFSHGTQDLYPTFLREQHHFDTAAVTLITVILNIGAIVGSLSVAILSQHFGRRRMIIAAALAALPVAYFWAYAPSLATLALGAFVMQICVQGAWGVVPAHLNELSPAEARGTFAGTVYQLGNLIASVNAVLQASIAENAGGNYSLALVVVAIGAALAIATVAWLGPEAHGVEMKG
jgi:SHS family lactate transporter-like MFS transporter